MRSTIREYQVKDSEFISPPEHEGLHNHDDYISITRDSYGNIVKVEEWYDSTLTRKISELIIYRTGDIIDYVETNIYDYTTGSGIVATVTGTITRINDYIIHTQDFRDNDMEGI